MSLNFRFFLPAILAMGFVFSPVASSTAQEIDNNPPRSTSLRVMTFNILHRLLSTRKDKSWSDRREAVIATIKEQQPDIVGLQEADRGQVDDLLRKLEGYAAFGRGEKGKLWYLNTVLYRKDLFTLVSEGARWLSEPGKEGKASWGAWLPRLVSYGTLEHKSSKAELVLFNAHFSSTSGRARLESARMLQKQLPKLAGKRPFMLIGDLNSSPRSEAYQTLCSGRQRALLRDAYLEAGAPGDHGTIHHFSGKSRPGARIDHILVSGPLRGTTAKVITQQIKGDYPSDHFPVIVKLNWKFAAATNNAAPRQRKLY